MQQKKTMTNRTSERTYFQRRFFQKLASLKTLFRVQILTNILGIPAVLLIVQLIMCSHAVHSRGSGNLAEGFTALLTPSAAIATAVFTVVTALASFRYLGNKNENDMNVSLPLNARQRFAADYLAGLTVCLIPNVISAVLSFIFLAAGQLTMPYPEELNNFLNYTMEFQISSVPAALAAFSAGLTAVTLMLFTVTVLITVCCGNITFAAIFTVIANIAVPAVLFTADTLRYLKAAQDIAFEHIIGLMSVTSPAGGIIELMGLITPYSSPFISFGLWISGFLFVTLLFLFSAFRLYMKRRSEDVSKIFVFTPAYGIILAAVVFSAAGFTKIMEFGMIPAAVAAAAAFILSELLKNNFSFKPSELIKNIPYALLAFLAFFIIQKSGVPEGYSAPVPDSDKVSYAVVSSRWDDSMNRKELKITEPDSLKMLTEVQQLLMDNNTEPEEGYDFFNTVHIIYKLKNGKNISFVCFCTDSAMQSALQRAITGSENAMNEYSCYFEYNLKNYYYLNELQCAMISVEEKDNDNFCLYFNDDTISSLKEITDAFRKDTLSLRNGISDGDSLRVNSGMFVLSPDYANTTEALYKARDIMTMDSVSPK